MLRSIEEITGYDLRATDGTIGSCRDFLFDDEQWTVRYMVADTGNWLPGRRVLISPASIDKPDWKARELAVRLSKQEIEDAPPLAADAPVSRRFEANWAAYHGWGYYWYGNALWGGGSFPDHLRQSRRHDADLVDPEATHLRSASEVEGYRIDASDGNIGHVEDFIVNDESWSIHYLVIDTRNWLPGGKKVLISPNWISDVSWNDNEVSVWMTKDQVKESPEFDPDKPVSRAFEKRLHDHYGRPVYWAA